MAAMRDKEAKYSDLLVGDRCRLVVVGIKTGGRWSSEAVEFVDKMAGARAREAPPVLRRSAHLAWRYERNSFEHESEARVVVEIRRWWQQALDIRSLLVWCSSVRWGMLPSCALQACKDGSRLQPLRPLRLRLTSLPVERAISISSRHFGNEMDLAGSEGSESMKIDNIKPHVSFQQALLRRPRAAHTDACTKRCGQGLCSRSPCFKCSREG